MVNHQKYWIWLNWTAPQWGVHFLKKCSNYLQTLFSQLWWRLSPIAWRNKRLNSNGVGVLPLCFFTMTFMEAGNEVWNSSFLFCPQPSWKQMNNALWRGLTQEQQPRSQNVKLVRKTETLVQVSLRKLSSSSSLPLESNMRFPFNCFDCAYENGENQLS